ncbi:5608_t:CDS:2, partial [Dentiscutata heterogama]
DILIQMELCPLKHFFFQQIFSSRIHHLNQIYPFPIRIWEMPGYSIEDCDLYDYLIDSDHVKDKQFLYPSNLLVVFSDSSKTNDISISIPWCGDLLIRDDEVSSDTPTNNPQLDFLFKALETKTTIEDKTITYYKFTHILIKKSTFQKYFPSCPLIEQLQIPLIESDLTLKCSPLSSSGKRIYRHEVSDCHGWMVYPPSYFKRVLIELVVDPKNSRIIGNNVSILQIDNDYPNTILDFLSDAYKNKIFNIKEKERKRVENNITETAEQIEERKTTIFLIIMDKVAHEFVERGNFVDLYICYHTESITGLSSDLVRSKLSVKTVKRGYEKNESLLTFMITSRTYTQQTKIELRKDAHRSEIIDVQPKEYIKYTNSIRKHLYKALQQYKNDTMSYSREDKVKTIIFEICKL